jgi:prepilin-type N-terminal cleavage/methylation domain-containing protein/prepilin-type processing-associated H-X9-DG protein
MSPIRKPGELAESAFTLIELLVVVAVISVLAALLLPALSQAKAKALSIKCRSNLHQVGLALQMYVGDNSDSYPFLLDGPAVWTDKLASYLSVVSTNDTRFTCPAFKAVIHSWISSNVKFFYGAGYGYNGRGTGSWKFADPPYLGLGFSVNPFVSPIDTPTPATSEAQVISPAEMFAVTDSFYLKYDLHDNDDPTSGEFESFPFINRQDDHARFWDGVPVDFYPYCVQQPPQHGISFNMLFSDGHVSPVRIADLFDVRKTAANWNNDNQPHPETW